MLDKKSLRHQAALLALLAGSASATEPTAAPITIAQAVNATRAAYVTVAGPVVPWEEMTLSSQVGNLPILDTTVEVGDHVERGAVLAHLDDRTLYPELAAAEAGLDQAHAQREEAVANRDRALALKGTGALSEQMILQAQTRAEEAQAQEAIARAALAAARLKVAHAVIRAPDAGVITERQALLGQMVSVGQPLFRMIRQGRLEWRPEVPAEHFTQLPARAAVELDLNDTTHVTGHLRTLAPAVNASTQRGTVFAQLESHPGLHAGLYLRGRIELPARAVVLVPSASVVVRNGASWVVTLEGQHAHLVKVTVGERGSEQTEILAGLSAGTSVIVRGAGFLSEGSPVRVTGPQASVSRS